MTAVKREMADANLTTEIARNGVDSAVKVLAGLVIGWLITLLTRVSKKEFNALVARVDQNQAANNQKLSDIEKASKNVATEQDLRDLRTELRGDFQKA